jgi:hypothetical protein
VPNFAASVDDWASTLQLLVILTFRPCAFAVVPRLAPLAPFLSLVPEALLLEG